MQARNTRSWREHRMSLGEAVSAVGWYKLLLWSAVAAVPVAIATNTFWLMIETALPPSMARGFELVPYFGGMFVATIVGQLLGPYAALRWEIDRLDPGEKVWFGANNPLAELNRVLWNIGTQDEAMRFRANVISRTDDFSAGFLDAQRRRLLTLVSRNLESVPKLFHVPGINREDVAEFGPTPPDETLLSLARRMRHIGWGQVELKPSWEWVAYTPLTVFGSVVLLVAMVLVLALVPATKPGSDGFGVFFYTLIVQSPFYFAAIALLMLPSAGRPSSLVQAALPAGLQAGNLDESLGLARDPFERIRLFLGALRADDQKALLQATHFALWKTLRACRVEPRGRSART
jgi:hypothetical protein